MNTLYPIFLKLRGKKCIVVGGGRVAMQKAEKLLEAGAEVAIISPRVIEEMEDYAAGNSMRIVRRQYRRGDLDGAFFVISATDSEEVNVSIAREAREKGILCNIVDAPSFCDFYVPSVFTQGDLKIAISTNGKSPAVARKIREELSLLYGRGVASILRSLGSLRKKLEDRVPDSRKRGEILSGIVQSHTLFSLKGGKREELTKLRKEIRRWS